MYVCVSHIKATRDHSLPKNSKLDKMAPPVDINEPSQSAFLWLVWWAHKWPFVPYVVPLRVTIPPRMLCGQIWVCSSLSLCVRIFLCPIQLLPLSLQSYRFQTPSWHLIMGNQARDMEYWLNFVNKRGICHWWFRDKQEQAFFRFWSCFLLSEQLDTNLTMTF